MVVFHHKLSVKLSGILLLFFVVALIAIGLTLWVSWQLEGGAAAINDMGSQRMHSYRIAYLLSENVRENVDRTEAQRELLKEISIFENTLTGLKQGDPARPLFLPRNREIRDRMTRIESQWQRHIKPMIMQIIGSNDRAEQQHLIGAYRPAVESFVAGVNDMVLALEQDNSRNTALLRSFQLSLVALALAGTIILIYLIFLLIIRPVTRLQEGIQRMADEDFSVRLPMETRDEFGELTIGFNRMADHLEGLYATLEQRVEEKTRSLEEKNRELAMLYEVTSFLNEPFSEDELSRGFLKKLMAILAADAGAVRLLDPTSQHIHLFIQEGLAEDLAKEEACLDMGECLCGEAAQHGAPVIRLFDSTRSPLDYACQKAGYAMVSVFPVRFKKQLLGIFNLYFKRPCEFSPTQRQLLETLGQHLGIAIENQRLVARDRELAISEERNLLAQELHDSIAQSLAFLNIQAQMLEDSLKHGNIQQAREGLTQIREGVQESYDDVRELLVHFRTRLNQADVEAAIRGSLDRFEGQTGIATSFHDSGTGIPLSPEDELQVLHIVQEALSNVRKHSGATAVRVEMQRGPVYRFSVRDNGKGFEQQAFWDKSDSHVGLRIMKERAHRIGGDLQIGSAPGKGTEVTLILPGHEKSRAA